MQNMQKNLITDIYTMLKIAEVLKSLIFLG